MNDELARQAKELAQNTGRTFTQLVEDAILGLLSNKRVEKPAQRTVLPVSGGSKPVTMAALKQAFAELDLEHDLKSLKRGHAANRR